MDDASLPLQHPSSSPANPRHEAQDANAAWVLASVAMLTATIALVYVASWWTLDSFKTISSASTVSRSISSGRAQQLPLEPRLEGIDELETTQSPKTGLNRWKTLNELEKQSLDTYGWVDRESGLVHIPIRTAMQIGVENHLFPVAPANPTDYPKSKTSKSRVNP
jgi:hypothetical protein